MARILSGLSHQGAGAPKRLLFTCGHFSPSFSLCSSPSGTKCQLVSVALFLGSISCREWTTSSLTTGSSSDRLAKHCKQMTQRGGYSLWGSWSFTVICQWPESSSRLADQLLSTASLSDLLGWSLTWLQWNLLFLRIYCFKLIKILCNKNIMWH